MTEENTGQLHPPPPPSTPRVAPWDAVQELSNRLDRLATILEGWAPGGAPGVSYEFSAIWEAGDKKTLLVPVAILVAGTTDSEMADFRKGKRLIIKVTSTLDQAITVQPVGNLDNTIVGATNIGLAPIPCPAGANIHIGLAWGDWHPYIGVILTHAIAPTLGTVKVEAVVQE